MSSNGVVPNTCLPTKSHAPITDNRAQQMLPLVSPDTPTHCTSHIQPTTTTLTAQPQARARLSVRFADKQDGTILPPSDIGSSSPMSNYTRQLLSEARKFAVYESWRTGRRITAMDVILDPMRSVATTQPYRCAAKTHFPQAHKHEHDASKAHLGRVELYQLEEAAIIVLAAAYSQKISAERSTSVWPPNFDG